jgi:ribosome biogenesis SPOUT family RNA methylase Rps3
MLLKLQTTHHHHHVKLSCLEIPATRRSWPENGPKINIIIIIMGGRIKRGRSRRRRTRRIGTRRNRRRRTRNNKN